MNIYEHIDYTLLKATATLNDIWNLCEEAEEKGTLGPLAADNSVMNYYKGRACVLYHQLYLLNGSFSMD